MSLGLAVLAAVLFGLAWALKGWPEDQDPPIPPPAS